MQSLRWYIRRLGGMNASEIAWRLSSAGQTQFDRLRVLLEWYPTQSRALRQGTTTDSGAFLCFSALPNSGRAVEDRGFPLDWTTALRSRADKVRRHRLSYFDLEGVDLGDPIAWNRDHALGKNAPLIFSPSIDYRDTTVAGDCKLVWEPNRHHHLVVLARAYRVAGDVGYAQAVVEQLESWLDQNPFGKGMNWRSPLELGIRLINWVWTLELIRESGLVREEFRERILHSAYQHIWEIQRKYSRGSSANNHLIGEAAGVYVAARYFHELAVPDAWRRKSREILEAEIVRQSYPDGCTREQAFGYHLFIAQFFLVAGLVGRNAGEEFSDSYWSRLEKMIEFAGLLTEGGDRVPMVGDADDGYVLDLGPGGMDPAGIFCTGAVLFGRRDFHRWAGRYSETTYWLLGKDSEEKFDRLTEREVVGLESRAFPDSGYYLLQSGHADSSDRISVVFDCGELGYGSIAAHGHADALSVCLRAFGEDVLVDPGTYDYFTHPEWRKYFRSTRAHNTANIDGQDQSLMLGSFLWGKRARARCVAWSPSPDGGSVVGEHDGYSRLPDPVLHRRRVELQAGSRTVIIGDEIEAAGGHAVEFMFHFAEGCSLTDTGKNRFVVETGKGQVVLEFDVRLNITMLRGGETPGPGCVSRGYHRKTAAPALRASVATRGRGIFEHRIAIGEPSCP